MTYELAKELKDAGFPQTRRDATLPLDRERGTVEPLMVPTLSELIDACGECFGSLGRGWHDDESVARLWLALNKHETA